MAEEVTKDQHDFFRALYDEEERTAAQLENRAKVFRGVISAILAAVLLKASDARAPAESLHVPWWLFLTEALTMTCALLLILWALRVRDFEAVNDGVDVLAGYEEHWPSPAEFFEDRAVDYAVASSRNRKMNSETAGVLAWAGRLLSAGRLMLIVIVCYAIRRGMMSQVKAKANGTQVVVQHKSDSTATLQQKIDARKSIRVVKK